jgi:hypothetical protein
MLDQVLPTDTREHGNIPEHSSSLTYHFQSLSTQSTCLQAATLYSIVNSRHIQLLYSKGVVGLQEEAREDQDEDTPLQKEQKQSSRYLFELW